MRLHIPNDVETDDIIAGVFWILLICILMLCLLRSISSSRRYDYQMDIHRTYGAQSTIARV